MSRSMHLVPGMLVACLLTVGLVPRAACAQDNFKLYLNAAIQLYRSGENERALEQLQRARMHSWEAEQDVLVELYEGLSLVDLGQREQALAAFETGLLLNPDAKLPEKVSPKLNGEFEAVRARVRKKLSQSSPPETGKTSAPSSVPGTRPMDVAPKSSTATTAAKVGPSSPAPASPNLEPSIPPASALYLPTPTLEKSRSRVPVAPVVLGGVGVVAVGVGTVFRLQSRSNISKANEAYEGRLPPQSEVSTVAARLEDARGQARMANVMFGTAALAVGSAVVTWLLASDDGTAEPKGTR